MRVSPTWTNAWRLVLLGAYGASWASAGPSINVALRASFNSAPYLVELLETAAEENSTAYFPILDRIADGYFQAAKTDEELFSAFTELIQSDGHITDAETLSTFRFALSVRSAAPRIEAHYQFYNTSVEPSLVADQGAECDTWVSFRGSQYCSPDLENVHGGISSERTYELPFDRILGHNTHALPSILYADITLPSFGKFHKTLKKTAEEGRTSYRIRHRPSSNAADAPLVVNGYGVELQLKRTDYIVIDDRPAVAGEKFEVQTPLMTELQEEEEVSDLKPLSKEDVSNLGLKAASFVMKSEQPLDTLLKLVQDFPKYSSAIVAHNISDAFLTEHRANRERLGPAGSNVIWLNGVQIQARDVNPFALLEQLRREKKLINGIQSQGLSAAEAVSLLSHSAIAETQSDDEPQRYDFRDELEGGNVIVWLNDIEQDEQYQSWPSSLQSLLQRTYPGQLPSVRRDIHNAILPVDFTLKEDLSTIVETIESLVKRGIPIRWGLVPSTKTSGATEQAKVVYHLHKTYGTSAVIAYLGASLHATNFAQPNKGIFDAATGGATPLEGKEVSELKTVLSEEAIDGQIQGAKQYLARLAADKADPPMFVNGVPIAQSEDWLQTVSIRISSDLRQVQKGVFEQAFQEDAWVPQFFLIQAAVKRNPMLIPENDKDMNLINMAEFESAHGESFGRLPRVGASESSSRADWAHLTYVADFDSESGFELLKAVAQFREEQPNVELVLLHNPEEGAEHSSTSEDLLEAWIKSEKQLNSEKLLDILALDRTPSPIRGNSTLFWDAAKPILQQMGLKSGDQAILVNGRVVGPVAGGQTISKDDLETLITYETDKRSSPVNKALEALDLALKVASPFDLAKIQSLVGLSTISDVPEGMFESASTLRIDRFKQWDDAHTSITKGDNSTASFQIVALLDPASEVAQKWTPILKVLSEMEGVHLRIFLNPKEMLNELPIKRFYRYLLRSQPAFSDDGSVTDLAVQFQGIPKEALLNLGMDVPPSWLVAPEESIHDLDNVRLSSLSAGANIDATYGLESILIEGHSRDTTNGGQAPRGAEVVLATEKEPHFADTIIMANLGYLQFKANPGFYNIQLKKGRSQEIFSLDSAGSAGWLPAAGDETSEIALMSFQGLTLFPRLSRQPGQDNADVLATDEGLAAELAEKGSKKVNKLLNRVGIKFDTEQVLKKGASFLQGSRSSAAARTQAEINIFSVASGHLYERMLNIMMLSVMKHTKHTVKFWFIEQFLSPSFKSFLPHMAAEYGFDFEMVTYKWPHWLRGQTEKQREIWGYKILFLDVLFPLDLDKVIFVDADQIVRTDMYELVKFDLGGAPYGFTPMCDSRTEMEGFRFWKTGYWATFLRGRPYHISALYVVDLQRFRQLAAGDRLRQQYHSLSADPNSLSNLDQDLPNNMQFNLEIKSLPQEWLWCETWCSDESLKEAKTIDLCNNPQTKEPKLDRARRQVPEWNLYDEEVAGVMRKWKGQSAGGDEEVKIDIQELEQIKERERKVAEEKEKAKKEGRQHVIDEL